jgi:hypothetical protein
MAHKPRRIIEILGEPVIDDPELVHAHFPTAPMSLPDMPVGNAANSLADRLRRKKTSKPKKKMGRRKRSGRKLLNRY